jgi:hypothetical protein
MLAVGLTAGVIYFLLTQLGFVIPCIFHRITGFYCPGCGVTRMCINIIKLDFYSAFRSNPAVFVIVPFLAIIFAVRAYSYLKYGTAKHEKWMTVIEITSLTILIIFGVLRNIPAFSFLAPM